LKYKRIISHISHVLEELTREVQLYKCAFHLKIYARCDLVRLLLQGFAIYFLTQINAPRLVGRMLNSKI
jgi:hypothetical protein